MIDEIKFIEKQIERYEWFKEYFEKDREELNIAGAPKKELIQDMLDMYKRILEILKHEKERLKP